MRASSDASASFDEKTQEADLDIIPQQNKHTVANIFPEPEVEANADIEKAQKPSKPAAGGHSPADFPDGGLQAWLVVFGGWCGLFVSFGWINCIGVFQEYYQEHQLSAYSPSDVAWIPSLEAFMMFFGGPIFGKIFDSYGPRYLLLAGSFFHVFGLMMTSLSSEYYQFLLAQGVCSAMGASMVFYSCMNCVGTWFFKKRGAAFGIMASGSSLGGVIFPIMVVKLIPQIGFAWTMRACAFMILGLLVATNLFVKSRLPPRPKPLVIMEFIRPLREPPYLLVVAAAFVFAMGMFLPFNFVILQGQANGMSVDLSNYLIPILNATSIFGRILPGMLADKFGRFNVMIITCFASAILVLALWIPAHGNAAIIVFSALYGFTSGAYVSMGPSIIAQISDVRQIGVRTGTMFGIVSFAVLVGSPIGGALVTRDNGGYLCLQIFGGLMMAVGAVLFVVARWLLCGFQLKVI